MDQNGKGHQDGKKFENMRITMYHPFYSWSVLGIISLVSDYHHAKSQIATHLTIIYTVVPFFLLGYEKIIALGFKNPRKNKFIFSESCNLLVTMI